MAMNFHTGNLTRLSAAVATSQNRLGLLNDSILAMQGKGNSLLNSIVNDLVFLRRELMNDVPDKDEVFRLLGNIYNKTGKVGKSAPKEAYDAAKKLRETILFVVN